MFSATAITLATAFLKLHEGFRAQSYRDQAGVWTVGYGSTRTAPGLAVTPHMGVTVATATAMLERSLRDLAADLDGLVEVALTDHQGAALLSFAYNVGLGAFKGSTLLERLNAGDTAGAAVQFGRWDLVGRRVDQGLVNRRKAEAAMFATPDATPAPATPKAA